MKNKVGVGLIGFGLAGRTFHAPFISNVPGLDLKKIRATNNHDVELAKQLHPEAEIVSDSKEIYADEAIQLVVIATPNPLHFSLAKEALLAGKHVLIDKPFTITTAEANELIALAQKQNKLLTVYHNRRYDSDFKTIKKVIESQQLGNLVEYEAHFDKFRNFIKPNTWKEESLPGSGILYDLGSHLIDQALHLFGHPKEVYGDLRAQRRNSNVIDNFEVVLYYEELKVILKAGMLVKTAGPHFILLGNQGSFVKYGMDVQEEALKLGKVPFNSTNWGMEPESLWGTLDTTLQGLSVKGKIESEHGDYTGIYSNVYKTILGEVELHVKPEEARDVIKVIELAMQSNEEKRRVEFK